MSGFDILFNVRVRFVWERGLHALRQVDEVRVTDSDGESVVLCCLLCCGRKKGG